ncbi:hypothetical protein P3X46_024259 [Hevea brasiliensis]|uniref:HIT-type domain-containing protein n=1 Tax=Hevea brasiliensis TaxID=3981 RepID=A0ABQ9L3M9_HEVBR|nr:uncharacterized protein LOC110669349 [Hevea brasiliensis]KAJ9158698.1 hypothetical protein P3X46_024259 [Hevea brasiliensis]
MEQEPQSKDQSSRNPNPLCEECKENPSKYKCPGCSIRSCSLPCVKAHKQRTGCSGKRLQTQFVPLSQFNDNLLLSDYSLLEEMKRVAESAQRMRTKLCAYPQFRLPAHLRSLKGAAAGRRTKLLFLPSGMSKREKNQSRYNQRKKFISWTIEWRFHSTDVILLDHGVHEDTYLCSVIEKHLKPGPWNHQLRQFCDEHLDSLKFLIRKYPKGPKSPFYELDIKAPLKQQLANVVILEYPVIYVFLPSHSYDFEVVKDVKPVTNRPESKNSVHNDESSPKGVAFREEEIEENDDPSNPQVYDFLKNVILSPLHEIPHQSISENTLCEQSDALAREAASNNSHYNSQTMEPGIFEAMDFDFDQGLMDAYSDLIGQVNPDDFLDLEGEFPKEERLEERKDFWNSRGTSLVQEELEEGEIVE